MRDEEPSELYCLRRVAEQLAYKACRSAIMIGDPLNIAQMSQIVQNLGGLQKPWVPTKMMCVFFLVL
jgi:DNA mismatch repair protein PMS2